MSDINWRTYIGPRSLYKSQRLFKGYTLCWTYLSTAATWAACGRDGLPGMSVYISS